MPTVPFVQGAFEVRWLGRILFICFAVYCGALALLYAMQRKLLYPRDSSRAEIQAAAIPGLEEVEVGTADGETLVAWLVPPRDDKPVLLFFHGNGGNFALPARHRRFRALTEDGTGLFAINYRGYGGSTGAPTEPGLIADARAAYAEASRRFGAERLIGYGESLGSGVAVQLAATAKLRALILEAPFTSTAAVAQGIYPFVPVRLLMLDQFRSEDFIGSVQAPLLVLHGDSDRVVPITLGQALFEKANPPKRLVRFIGGGHENLPGLGSGPEIRRFLADAAVGRLGQREVVNLRVDSDGEGPGS